LTHSSRSANCGGQASVGAADTLSRISGKLNKAERPNSRGSAKCRSQMLVRTRPQGHEWEAVQEMFLASRLRFVRLAYAILRNKEDAEDAVQDAFLSACLHLRNFEGRSALTTWFTRIVLNAALVIRRKRKTSRIKSFPKSSNSGDIHWTETILASQPDPEMLYTEKETFQVIDGLLEEMSPLLRQALTTTYYDEKSNKEACALLGVKKGTFKSRLSRATRRLTNQAKRSLVTPIRRAAHSTFIPGRNDFQTLVARPAQVSPLEIALS
jgi:RNA polymerase sigma-70 factor, ECF subfamily